MDVPYGDIVQVSIHSPTHLAVLCDADPDCVGFNSNGWLKSVKGKKAPKEGCVWYEKK